MTLTLVNRTITAAVLMALAVTLGLWLSRAPLTAVPAAAPMKTAPEPTLAPPPPVRPATTPTVLEVPVEVIVAPMPVPADSNNPNVEPANESKPEPHPAYQPRHRGLFRRR